MSSLRTLRELIRHWLCILGMHSWELGFETRGYWWARECRRCPAAERASPFDGARGWFPIRDRHGRDVKQDRYNPTGDFV